VLRAAFVLGENPSLNQSYRELARYYGFKVDPTPPRAPEKKGRVESGVKYVKGNFGTTLAKEADIDQARRELERWTSEVANKRCHARTKRRPDELFAECEATSLLPLPEKRFEPVVWKRARVHRDCHVGFDKRLYSVPWRLVGKDVWIRATSASIEVFADDARVATHQRSYSKFRICEDTHLPEERRDLRHRSRAYWQERAEKIGPAARDLTDALFDADDVLHQLRAVQATITHLETFPADRAERAARRALFYGALSYRAVRDILRQGLDLQPLPTLVVEHDESQTYRFARTAAELLQLPKENTDEPH
jgi:hypothetical protein